MRFLFRDNFVDMQVTLAYKHIGGAETATTRMISRRTSLVIAVLEPPRKVWNEYVSRCHCHFQSASLSLSFFLDVTVIAERAV